MCHYVKYNPNEPHKVNFLRRLDPMNFSLPFGGSHLREYFYCTSVECASETHEYYDFMGGGGGKIKSSDALEVAGGDGKQVGIDVPCC